jgi:ribosome-associated protein
VVNALEDKKGENILLLDLHDVATFTDYFVVCTGTSDRMLDALADGVLAAVKQGHRRKGRREGRSSDGWLVLDFGGVTVHLFDPELRRFYRLEELWSQGKILLHFQ